MMHGNTKLKSTKLTYLDITSYRIKYSTVQSYGFERFKSGVVERFRRRYILYIVAGELHTANVAPFPRKIQLSGFSANLGGSPSKLIRISVVLLFRASVSYFI
jgi:hypothetical protein